MDKISSLQLRALLILDFLSIGILCVPSLAVAQGRNGYGVVIIGTALAVLYGLMADRVRTKRIKFIYLLLFLKTVLTGGLMLKIFTQLISATLLKNSSHAVIGLPIMLIALYGCKSGGKARGRMAEFLMPIVVCVLAFCLALSAKNGDFSDLKPIMCGNLRGLLLPSVLVSFMFFPLEFLSLIDIGEKTNKAVLSSVITSGVLLTAIVLIWLARFNTGNMDFPVLDLMYNGDFSTTFVIQQQGAVLTVVITAVYFMLNSLIFASSLALEKTFNIKRVTALSAFIIFVISILPLTATLDATKKMLYTVLIIGGFLFLVLVPVCLLLSGAVVKRGE